VQYINFDEYLQRVTSYIHADLDDELELKNLAEVAYLSPYHFHRTYRAERGETITTSVCRLRVHRASSQLAHSTSHTWKSCSLSNWHFRKEFSHVRH
jgi:AraC family transcriptional regulator